MSADPCEVRLQLAADGVECRGCGRVARYLVWGEPCSCQAVHGLECRGHAVCIEHAAELRRDGYPLHRTRTDVGTWRLSRIVSLDEEPRDDR